MKKFINSQSSDTDSGRFSGGAASTDSSFRVQDVSSTLIIKILITPLSKNVYACVSTKALVYHVKQKLLEEFSAQLTDCINCGLFAPPSNGRSGKFLEEDRPISAYVTDESSSNLEFTYKRRVCLPTPINLPNGDKTKNLPQSFLRAVARGDLKKVEKYLSKGFDPNFVCPKTDETPLTVAVGRPRPLEMIRALIAGGAHKDYRTRGGLTPLHKAAAIGNFEAVKALLDFGQSPNTVDNNGLTPLYHNILGDVDTRICHRLLYEYAQIEICDANGRQEIHQAALLGRTDQINLLIMYGADVNARSHSRPDVDPPGLPALPKRSTSKVSASNHPASTGQSQFQRMIGCGRETPLHYAAMAGQSATVRRLLYWGADPTLTNDRGRTPVQEALYRGNHEVAEIIRNFRGGAGASERDIGGSEGSTCGPFLPAPTYNQKRKPMTAPLQVSPLDHFVTLTVLGAERRGPSRSVTMPFPVSPSRQQATSPSNGRLRHLTPSPSPSPQLLSLCHLRSRACSEGDLMRTLNDEEMGDGKAGDVGTRPIRAVQSSRDRRNPRRIRRQKMIRGMTEVINTTESTTATRSRMRSWKSSHTLNEEDGDILDALPTMPRHRLNFRMMSPHTVEAASAMSLSRFRTAPALELSVDKGWTSLEPKTKTMPATSTTNIGDNAPVPANPFAPIASLTRPVSPRQRDSHHFPRSTRSPNQSGACSPVRLNPDPTSGGPIEPGTTRTVVLYKAFLPDASQTPTLGLSLRTVQNVSAVQRFVPTQAKPSLQLIKSVKPASPAYKAGLREGDYVIKINNVDVTRACHAEVVKLLDTLNSNAVVLEVNRPPTTPRSGFGNGEEHYAPHRQSTIGGSGIGVAVSAKTDVQRSVSTAGRIGNYGNSTSNRPAPYSPMLPMHAPPESRCISSEGSSVSSTDEAFCSQSMSGTNPGMTSPSVVDRRSNGREGMPRVHTAADYRIRNKFPGSRHIDSTPHSQKLSRKNSQQEMPRSRTINSFTEEIGVDTSSLNSFADTNSSLGISLRPSMRNNLATNTPTTGRPVYSVPQPPLRFLPHYNSPSCRGTDSVRPHCHERLGRLHHHHLTVDRRPLSMTGRSDGFKPYPGVGFTSDNARSFSSMSANTPPPPPPPLSQSSPRTRGSSFDPNDVVLPPPKEFCC